MPPSKKSIDVDCIHVLLSNPCKVIPYGKAGRKPNKKCIKQGRASSFRTIKQLEIYFAPTFFGVSHALTKVVKSCTVHHIFTFSKSNLPPSRGPCSTNARPLTDATTYYGVPVNQPTKKNAYAAADDPMPRPALAQFSYPSLVDARPWPSLRIQFPVETPLLLPGPFVSLSLSLCTITRSLHMSINISNLAIILSFSRMLSLSFSISF